MPGSRTEMPGEGSGEVAPACFLTVFPWRLEIWTHFHLQLFGKLGTASGGWFRLVFPITPMGTYSEKHLCEF